MCDILVATPAVTREGVMIFAKNSDRDMNEAQVLERLPAREHEAETVTLTYTTFPQARQTHAVILSRPWWIWGAEMGANAHGVVAGNTAVFSRKRVPGKGLLGMDILRLMLERCTTAREGMTFITETVEIHGQGGNCSYDHRFRYHNAFIVADAREAWVIETVDRHWVALLVEDVYSISNVLTIEDTWTCASESVEALRRKHPGFGFASYFSDRFYTSVAHGRDRRAVTYQALLEARGAIDAWWMFRMLQTHHTQPFRPEKVSARDICMHARSPLVPSQTASSQISVLHPDRTEHWFTGCSNPCLSLFKPVDFTGAWPEMGPIPGQTYTPGAYWWEVEVIHRHMHAVYPSYIEAWQRERDALQRDWFRERPATALAFQAERQFLEVWKDRLPACVRTPFHWYRNWMNRRAGLSWPCLQPKTD